MSEAGVRGRLRVLIVGLSSIAQRRVLPALAALEEIAGVDIVSRSKPDPGDWGKPGRFFADYGRAIAESDADLIYVSLPNSEHSDWIMAGLAAGKHVVVDKPATLSLVDAERCVKEARRRSLLLAEATVFAHHPQIEAMLAFVAAHGPLTQIEAEFIIPPMPVDNFRNYGKFGGGCLQDMGPYAAAVARLFGGGPLSDLAAFAAPYDRGRDIDMGFSLVARFDSGVRLTGHFSFESEYHNRLVLIGRGGALATERAFSLPADLAPVWQVRRSNQATIEAQPAADAFRLFLKAAVRAVVTGDRSRFYDDLLYDARFRDCLAAALSQGEGDATR
jgi:predicted dehydrogenase